MRDHSSPPSFPGALLRALRPQQWVKNFLLLLPLLLAHVLPWQSEHAAGQWRQACLGLAAFCMAASAIYVINDLSDLAADRAHPTKRNRPFASGALPTFMGPPLVLVLLMLSGGFCVALPGQFAVGLLIYVMLSTTYSLWLKRRLLIDVFVLAGLYTLRLLAGGLAAQVEVSHWLMAFSIFLFVSLAFAKRYAELARLEGQGLKQASGRNYTVDDLRIIESTGPASGYLAVLVLALYINDSSSAAKLLYKEPLFLWALCPLMMYWITRIWFVARRGGLDEDPIRYTIRDRVSWLTMLAAAVCVVLASQRW